MIKRILHPAEKKMESCKALIYDDCKIIIDENHEFRYFDGTSIVSQHHFSIILKREKPKRQFEDLSQVTKIDVQSQRQNSSKYPSIESYRITDNVAAEEIDGDKNNPSLKESYILLTNYGGDGRVTFGIPDFRLVEPNDVGGTQNDNAHYIICADGILPLPARPQT